MGIVVRPRGPAGFNKSIEFVERKRLGHPDTLAESTADETSRQFSEYCLAEFVQVAHHWFDKVLFSGGIIKCGVTTK